MIPGQMTIYDFIEYPYHEMLNPLRVVAKKAEPCWTDSKLKIIKELESDSDIDILRNTIRHEYCPYGFDGYYGSGRKNWDVVGWHFTNGGIRVILKNNDGKEIEKSYTWADFAREIFDLWCSGEYGGEL